MQKNQLVFNELNGEFQKSKSERYANLLVYLLVALLLLALACIAYLWRQRSLVRENYSNELPWWKKNKPQDKGWGNSSRSADNSTADYDPSGKQGKSKKSIPAEVDLDLDFGGIEDSSLQGLGRSLARGVKDPVPPLLTKDRADFAMSMTHISRAVKAEELFDVQQQADFFVSLGQHEQAIEVLREHIGSNAQTSALVYLDLFNLYHLLKREADYEELRENFSQLFNVKMPEFALYTDSSPGLEAYPGALTRIVALWPSSKVLEIIEESIFRKLDERTEAFNLGAYRELLLLYAIAKDVIGSEPGGAVSRPKTKAFAGVMAGQSARESGSSKFFSTSIQPLSASVAEDSEGTLPSILPAIPKPSLQLGLDVDLSDIFGEDLTSKVDSGEAGTTVESDSHFFAQFADDAFALSPESPPVLSPSGKPLVVTDNLIDFDSFDSSNLANRYPPSSKS
jgi:tetratricopeptide (TPR) repeat protein